MADFSKTQRRAMQYWGPIESVTLRGGSTEELWAAINAHATALGYEKAGISALDVNWLRQQAVANREAMSRLEQLGPEDRITGEAMARAPWGRTMDRQNAVPMWSVRFEHIVRDEEGNESTIWRTTSGIGSLPRSRHELELAIEEDARNLADEYEQEHVGIGSYSLMVV